MLRANRFDPFTFNRIIWLLVTVAVSGSISRPALIAVIGAEVCAVTETVISTRIE